MHRGLPLVVFIKSVSFSSSESKFGTSVISTMLVGRHAVHYRTPGLSSGLHYLPSSLSPLRVARSPAWVAIREYH